MAALTEKEIADLNATALAPSNNSPNVSQVSLMSFIGLSISSYILPVIMNLYLGGFPIVLLIAIILLAIIAYFKIGGQSVSTVWIYLFIFFFDLFVEFGIGIFGGIIGVWGILGGPIITYLILRSKNLIGNI